MSRRVSAGMSLPASTGLPLSAWESAAMSAVGVNSSSGQSRQAVSDNNGSSKSRRMINTSPKRATSRRLPWRSRRASIERRARLPFRWLQVG